MKYVCVDKPDQVGKTVHLEVFVYVWISKAKFKVHGYHCIVLANCHCTSWELFVSWLLHGWLLCRSLKIQGKTRVCSVHRSSFRNCMMVPRRTERFSVRLVSLLFRCQGRAMPMRLDYESRHTPANVRITLELSLKLCIQPSEGLDLAWAALFT